MLVTLDSTKAVSNVIPAAGGALKATGADGSIYTELVVAVQAVDLRSARTHGRGVRRTRDLVRSCVSFTNEGTPVPQDLEPLGALVHWGRFISLRSDDR